LKSEEYRRGIVLPLSRIQFYHLHAEEKRKIARARVSAYRELIHESRFLRKVEEISHVQQERVEKSRPTVLGLHGQNIILRREIVKFLRQL